MKKVTLRLNGVINEEAANGISGALNDLSGVVAADTIQNEGKAIAYAGDRLPNAVLEKAVRQTGHAAETIKEEYMNDVNDVKKSLT